MGIQVDIHEVFQISYEEKLENGLWENEYDHIFIGKYFQNNFNLNPEEIQNIKSISLDDLKTDLQQNPENYTFWFKLIFGKMDFEDVL
jgi:isopentenyl-diphosphate delta-isomerase